MKKDITSVYEGTIYELAKDFQEKTGVNIYQSQLTDLLRKKRPDLAENSISQYVAIYVNVLCAKGLIKKTSKSSSTNLYVK